MPLRRTLFQDQKLIETSKWIFWCTCWRGSARFMIQEEMEQLQQYRDGLSMDIFLLHSQRQKMPARPVLSATDEDNLQMSMG